MTEKVFILGSCVTRDAFALVRNDFELLEYVARTSFGSAFRHNPFRFSLGQLDPDGKISSKFQLRMIETDLLKQCPKQLSQLGMDDTVVIDFIDERFHLLEYDQTFATFSAELQQAKPLDHHSEISLIKANTDAHFALWCEGAKEFSAIASQRGFRVILNKVLWASRASDGRELNRNYVNDSNVHLDRMYDFLVRTTECETIDYDPNVFVADADHKWGISPFHYVHEAYEAFMSALGSMLRPEKTSNKIRSLRSSQPVR